MYCCLRTAKPNRVGASTFHNMQATVIVTASIAIRLRITLSKLATGSKDYSCTVSLNDATVAYTSSSIAHSLPVLALLCPVG